jgi:hypothetical protein
MEDPAGQGEEILADVKWQLIQCRRVYEGNDEGMTASHGEDVEERHAGVLADEYRGGGLRGGD